MSIFQRQDLHTDLYDDEELKGLVGPQQDLSLCYVEGKTLFFK